MKQSSLTGSAALAIAFAFSAPAPAQAQDLGLVKDLAGLGVTTSQASGGLLAIMQLAQTNLGPADFGKLMGMLPEMNDFMGSAGGGGAAAGAMGAATGAMGAAAAATSKEETVHEHDAEHKDHAEHEDHAEHTDHAAEHEAHEAEHMEHAAEADEACCGGEMGDAAGAMGGAAAIGGAAAGMPQISGLSELAAVPSLVSAFSGLGMGPEMIQQFAPIILKYVMGSGGSAAAQLLGTGLGLGLV
jgi:hypothetical protein